MENFFLEGIERSVPSEEKARQVAGDLPGGPVVKSLPANTEDAGFSPWSREIPHSAKQLNLCATASEPSALLETGLCSERSHHSEKPTDFNKE